MARITVEDCIDKFESRFELVLVASNRARKLHSGESPTVEKDNDKPTVISLREIADETISIDSLKDKLIQEYQTVSPLDEDDLSLDFSGSEIEIKDELTSDDVQLGERNDDHSKVDEEENEDIHISNEDHSNEDVEENDSTSKSSNDGYSDISNENNSENL